MAYGVKGPGWGFRVLGFRVLSGFSVQFVLEACYGFGVRGAAESSPGPENRSQTNPWTLQTHSEKNQPRPPRAGGLGLG